MFDRDHKISHNVSIFSLVNKKSSLAVMFLTKWDDNIWSRIEKEVTTKGIMFFDVSWRHTRASKDSLFKLSSIVDTDCRSLMGFMYDVLEN